MNKDEIFYLIKQLHWGNAESVQNAAIEKLVDIDDKDIPLLIQPFGDKSYWESAAIVLRRIGHPRVDQVIPELLGWLADLNWPGANLVFDLLKSSESKVLEDYLRSALIQAKAENDYMWIAALKELIVAKGIEPAFKSQEMKSILELADLA